MVGSKADTVREVAWIYSYRSSRNADKGMREGVKNPKNFADVLYGRPINRPILNKQTDRAKILSGKKASPSVDGLPCNDSSLLQGDHSERLKPPVELDLECSVNLPGQQVATVAAH